MGVLTPHMDGEGSREVLPSVGLHRIKLICPFRFIRQVVLYSNWPSLGGMAMLHLMFLLSEEGLHGRRTKLNVCVWIIVFISPNYI